jgi:hypothetical protein
MCLLQLLSYRLWWATTLIDLLLEPRRIRERFHMGKSKLREFMGEAIPAGWALYGVEKGATPFLDFSVCENVEEYVTIEYHADRGRWLWTLVDNSCGRCTPEGFTHGYCASETLLAVCFEAVGVYLCAIEKPAEEMRAQLRVRITTMLETQDYHEMYKQAHDLAYELEEDGLAYNGINALAFQAKARAEHARLAELVKAHAKG